jgi:hypothetical protein
MRRPSRQGLLLVCTPRTPVAIVAESDSGAKENLFAASSIIKHTPFVPHFSFSHFLIRLSCIRYSRLPYSTFNRAQWSTSIMQRQAT